ncbi:MAG: hypothetical protein GY855_16705 [candidate division Zixibacteria bacterium]|nr:hypothetical protein [candidate division Zixibacteria bacterium]
MKVAVPNWNNWISPVLDEAGNFTVVELDNSVQINREEINLEDKSPLERIQILKALGVNLILCGAVSNDYLRMISSNAIKTIPWLRGDIQQILEAFISNGLGQERFRMPGRGQRMWRCRKNRIRNRGKE